MEDAASLPAQKIRMTFYFICCTKSQATYYRKLSAKSFLFYWKLSVLDWANFRKNSFHRNSLWTFFFFYFPTNSATHLKMYFNYHIQKFQMFCTRRGYTDSWPIILPETKDLVWHTLPILFCWLGPNNLLELQLKMSLWKVFPSLN